jgi:hypothetical protein
VTALAIEVIGWAGGIALLVAYALVSRGIWPADGARYQWVNVLGAAALALNSAWNSAYPSTALNIVWIGLGGWALWRVARKR